MGLIILAVVGFLAYNYFSQPPDPAAQLEKAQTLSTGDVRLPASGKSKKTALDTAGITTSTANRCEQIADIAEAEFEAVILAAKENRKPVTYSDIERVVKKNHRIIYAYLPKP